MKAWDDLMEKWAKAPVSSFRSMATTWPGRALIALLIALLFGSATLVVVGVAREW